jgi:hypothetical protein
MDAPTPEKPEAPATPASASSEDKTAHLESVLGAELSKLANQAPKHSGPFENHADRIKTSVARLTSSSIEELQGLVSELQKMQEFLKAEVDSVQRQIDSALAGINIIVETIGPWKSIAAAQAQSPMPRSFRGGPAANIEPAPSRRAGI